MFCILFTVKDTTKASPGVSKELIGGNVEFRCLSATDPKWFYEKMSLPQNAYTRVGGRTMTLSNIRIHNAGTYYCLGQDNRLNYFLSPAKLLPIG